MPCPFILISFCFLIPTICQEIQDVAILPGYSISNNNELSISEFKYQNNICEDGKNGINFGDVLAKVSRYKITDDTLTLFKNDIPLATFKASYMLQ